MECKVGKCIHNENFKCNNNNKSNKPSEGTNCCGFDYDCELCQEIGFQHYKCPDCCLDEDEYHKEDDC